VDAEVEVPPTPVTGQALSPENAPVGEVQRRRLRRVRALSRMLDDALRIPGTRLRVGLDPLIGLVPGLGDVLGGLLSGYVIYEGVRIGVSRKAVVRMLLNVVVELLLGAFPAVGDLFDAGWKANARNVRLLEGELDSDTERRAGLLLLALVLGILVLAVVGMWMLLDWLWRAIPGALS
jgi:hypothetical protein